MKRRMPVILLATLTTSCALHGPPPPHPHTGKGYSYPGYRPLSEDGNENGVGKVGDPTQEGWDFCRAVEIGARDEARDKIAPGWAFIIIGGIATGAGTVLAATSPDDASDGRKALNASLPLGGAIISTIAAAFLGRSDDSSALAGAASRAMELPDADANKQCNEALAVWNERRSEGSKIAIDMSKSKVDCGDGKDHSSDPECKAKVDCNDGKDHSKDPECAKPKVDCNDGKDHSKDAECSKPKVDCGDGTDHSKDPECAKPILDCGDGKDHSQDAECNKGKVDCNDGKQHKECR